MNDLYRAHGLVVSAPFAIGHAINDVRVPDLEIEVVEANATVDAETAPAGRVIAYLDTDRHYYTLVDQGPDGYLFRFHGLADVRIDERLMHVVCVPVPGADMGRLSIILGGTVMASILMLRGEAVLHASAVERDGVGVALVGNSGAGKSTLAAMACRNGCSLVTDDVLRVTTASEEARCFRGASELRLRPGSKALAAGEDFGEVRSSDGRRLWSPQSTELDEMPLSAIVIPRLRRSDHPLIATDVGRKAALFALVAYPRVHNWDEPRSSAAQFRSSASLVQQVPVYTLDVPWGTDVSPVRMSEIAQVLIDLGSSARD